MGAILEPFRRLPNHSIQGWLGSEPTLRLWEWRGTGGNSKSNHGTWWLVSVWVGWLEGFKEKEESSLPVSEHAQSAVRYMDLKPVRQQELGAWLLSSDERRALQLYLKFQKQRGNPEKSCLWTYLVFLISKLFEVTSIEFPCLREDQLILPKSLPGWHYVCC